MRTLLFSISEEIENNVLVLIFIFLLLFVKKKNKVFNQTTRRKDNVKYEVQLLSGLYPEK